MISDALMAKGTSHWQRVHLWRQPYHHLPDGSAYPDNGTLAGSTLNINKGLRILAEEAMVPFNYAINARTINSGTLPASDEFRKGSIRIGKDADLVVLDDNYDVLQTYQRASTRL